MGQGQLLRNLADWTRMSRKAHLKVRWEIKQSCLKQRMRIANSLRSPISGTGN